MKLKALVLSYILFNSFLGFSQSVKDTVKIKTVKIQSRSNLEKIHSLDSVDLYNPQHLNVGDLLSKKSHLFVKSYGIGSLASVSLRGSASAHTKLNWNGIVINSSMNGSTDISLIPLYFIDEVELSYGLKSLAEGVGGIGGTVHLNSNAEFIKKQQVELIYKLGSFGQQTVNTGFKLGGSKFQSSTKIVYNEADNDFEYRDLTLEGFPKKQVRNAHLEQKGISQTFAFRLKENKVLQTDFWYFNSKRNLPPLITLRDNVEFQEDENFKGLLKYQFYNKNGWYKLTAKSAFLADNLIYKNERASVNTRSQTKSFRNRIDANTSVFNKIVLRAQINYNYEFAESSNLNNELTREELGAYFSSKFLLSKKLNAEIEARWLNIIGREDFIIPSFKLNYFPVKNSSFEAFTLIGRNVNYPSLNDLNWQPFGNSELKAEESEGVEIGIKNSSKLNKNNLAVEYQVVGFYSDIKNYILWQPTAFGFWHPINLSKVETKGVEGNLNVSYSSKEVDLVIQTSYSYTESTNREKQHEFDDSPGKQLIYIPMHKGNVNGIISAKSYSLNINYQLVGRRYISSDNIEFLPSYRLIDLSLGKKVMLNKNSLQLTAGIKNLFNTEYQAIEWRPMPNRNYFIELSYRFTK